MDDGPLRFLRTELSMSRTLLRRFLVFQAFLMWQGGFLFYASVVVPVGTDVLGDPMHQGLVTQRVTNWLNLIGLVWHFVYAWDLFTEADSHRRRVWWRCGLWAVSFGMLAALAAIHIPMDVLIEANDFSIAFRRWHISYLWLSTGQWVAALGSAWLTLAAWVAPRHASEL
jgi:hypothetical protein